AVEGGDAALAALGEAQAAGEPFDLALVDVQMPHMDGFDLCALIQRDLDISATSLILLTSSGLRGDAARCRDLGIAGYLTKPVRASDLLEAIQAVLGAHDDSRGRDGSSSDGVSSDGVSPDGVSSSGVSSGVSSDGVRGISRGGARRIGLVTRHTVRERR